MDATVVPTGDADTTVMYPSNEEVASDSSRGCFGCRLFWRQFFALVRKNFLSKRRTPIQLLVELLVPPLFILMIGAIKSSINPETTPSFIPTLDSPVASFQTLETHSAYPNVLCFDNNIFRRCSCNNDIFDDEIDQYMTGGSLSMPGRALWSTVHAADTLYAMCGVASQASSSNCTAALVSTYFCSGVASDESLITTVCGENSFDSEPTLEQLTALMESGIRLADEMDVSLSVPVDEITSICQERFFVVMPDDSGSADTEAFEFFEYVKVAYPAIADHWRAMISESDFLSILDRDGYSQDEPDIYSFGVVFHSGAPEWEYTIRTNYTRSAPFYGEYNTPTTASNVDNKCRYPEDCTGSDQFDTYPWGRSYIASNVLAVQNLVDAFILNQTAGASVVTPTIRLTDFPNPEFSDDGFWAQIGSFFAILVVIAVMYPVSNVINALVREKELRIKEGLRMMGLTGAAHTASWVFHFFCTFLAISILMVMASGSLFENSDKGLVFFYFFFFFMATTAYCFYISSFFSKARTASTMGTLVFFVTLFPYFSVSSDDTPASTRRAACLLPPTCLALGTVSFAEFEDSGEGVTNATASQSENGFTFNDVIGMLFFDILLFSALAWYAGKVLPSEWGTQEKPWFLFTKRYWFPGAAAKGDMTASHDLLVHDESEGNDAVEEVSHSLRQQVEMGECVAMRGLTKSFKLATGGTKKAVDELNLTMYNGQITALLGHNGAGKTTTIGMLTGMTPVTSGCAFVNGLSVRGDMNRIRRNLGVCPQHDILFPDLTVREHLRMYAVLKGVPSSELQAAIKATISDVGLTEKMDERTKRLSGGQKRKLSVGIALIGGSQVVFLDEPTSGMDPHSRRFTWDLIRKNREGRTIVLTTHFMDEADLLGDRIAIMADGALRCCGSSLFLKNHYGVGYNMTIVRSIPALVKGGEAGRESTAAGDDNEHKVDEIEDVVIGHVPEATLLSNVGAEISFQLPNDASGVFRSLLSDLEAKKEMLGISSYGMSVTTLEEVFLRVANGTADSEARKHMATLRETQRQRSYSSLDGSGNKDRVNVRLAKGQKSDVEDGAEKGRVAGMSLFMCHLKGLTKKRFLAFSREKKMWSFVILAPALFVMVGLIILLSVRSVDQKALVLTPEVYNEGLSSPFLYSEGCIFNETVSACDADAIVDKMGSDLTTPVAVSFLSGSNLSGVGQVNTEVLSRETRLSYYGAATFREADLTSGALDYTLHLNYTALHAAPVYINQLHSAFLRLISGDDTQSIKTNLHPFPSTKSEEDVNESADAFSVVLFIMLAFSFVSAAWISFIVREREDKSKHQQVVSGVSLDAYWLSSFIWDFISYLIPASFTLIVLAAAGVTLFTGSSGLPATLLLLLTYGLSMPSFTYILSFAFKSHTIAQNAILFSNWILGVMAPTAVLIMSFFESLEGTASALGWVLRISPQFAVGQGLLNVGFRTIISLLADRTGEYDVLDGPIAGYGIVTMAVEAVVYFPLLLVVERLFAGSSKMSAACNKMILRRRIARLTPSQLGEEDEVDEDVAAEARRVQSGQANEDVVKVESLSKIYPSSKGVKVAVKSTSLGIPKGECFGLLGINGAGKSSTLAILSGEMPATKGQAFLSGFNVNKNPEAIHRLVGYCPQFDALFDTLTAREHLRLYAAIKGIPSSDVERAVDDKIEEMDLNQYADRLAGGYSGGNKRKLSVAIAMIGDPQIVFLDEPSTGMDPMARRHMWNVIMRIVNENKECAMILTTHSMEECEALCQRIGIMVGGRIRCLGSSQHLKTRFGKGYQIEASVTSNTPQEVESMLASMSSGTNGAASLPDNLLGPALTAAGHPELAQEITLEGRGAGIYHTVLSRRTVSAHDFAFWVVQEVKCSKVLSFMNESFTGIELREKQNAKMRFEFPPQEGRSLGDMFGLIEDNRQDLQMGEYSLSQTSLEQIFNGFAAKQEEEEGHAAGMQSS